MIDGLFHDIETEMFLDFRGVIQRYIEIHPDENAGIFEIRFFDAS